MLDVCSEDVVIVQTIQQKVDSIVNNRFNNKMNEIATKAREIKENNMSYIENRFFTHYTTNYISNEEMMYDYDWQEERNQEIYQEIIESQKEIDEKIKKEMYDWQNSYDAWQKFMMDEDE